MRFPFFTTKQPECDFIASGLNADNSRRRFRFYFLAVFFAVAVVFSFTMAYFNSDKGVIVKAVEKIKNFPASQLPQALRAMGGLPQSGDRIVIPAAVDEPDKTIQPTIAPFTLKAAAGAVMDVDNDNSIVFAKNADQPRSIASITKLMTAMVFLEHNPGWDNIYQIKREDRREGGRIYLYMGEKIKVRDLFYLSLVGSANTATAALVSSTGMDEKEFTRKMNEKANEMGLAHTVFYDPTGLSSNNISTAKEVAKLAGVALSDSDISEATLSNKYELVTLGGRKKTIYSTDRLLGVFPQNGIKIIGGKTGYLEAAGYSFTGKFIDHNGREMISVVLGGDSKESRFLQTKELIEWAYKNY